MVSRAIAPTMTGCGRPLCRQATIRARPPTAMVDNANDVAEDRSIRRSSRRIGDARGELEHVGVAQGTIDGGSDIG